MHPLMWVRLEVPPLRMSSDKLNRGERLVDTGCPGGKRKATEEEKKKEWLEHKMLGVGRLPVAITSLFQSYSPPPSLTLQADGITQRKNMDQFYTCCFELDDSYFCLVIMGLSSPLIFLDPRSMLMCRYPSISPC